MNNPNEQNELSILIADALQQICDDKIISAIAILDKVIDLSDEGYLAIAYMLRAACRVIIQTNVSDSEDTEDKKALLIRLALSDSRGASNILGRMLREFV